ncbi:ABC transporter substrate-binding protein [Ensifer sp. 4252]|uniref:ABC transporter substrate-binding protein n=1 Tax=Ensifer sp. 4252 TaxID=3373915 RepID=UPI003D1CCE1A
MLNRRQFTIASAITVSVLALGGRQAFAGPQQLCRFRLSVDPETLYNVQTMSLDVSDVLGSYILESLVYLDPQGKAQPWLADSWEYSEEGKVLTFKLKDGIVFHDGTPFDADAVKFHFDAVLDPAKVSPSKAIVGPLEKVEVAGPGAVVFRFSRPYAPFINLLAQPYFGFNSPTAVKASGDAYGRHPIGTGPFLFDQWMPGTRIELKRFDKYQPKRPDATNKALPYAEKIVLNVIAEEGVVTSALLTGELDAAGITADSAAPLQDNPQFVTISNEHAKNLMFLEFDYKKPPFNDRAFREAISYAIDREAVLAGAFGGHGAIALSPLSRGIPGYDDAVANKYGTPYDPEKAKSLLDAIGWHDNNGQREKDGQPARFTVRSYADSVTERALAVIQANLADIGIAVEVSTSDWGTFYPGLLTPDWDMALNRWTWSDPSVLSQLFRSPGHRQLLPDNPAIDRLLDAADTESDPTKRFSLVSEAQKAILEDRVILPLVTDWPITFVQSNLSGYHFDYLGFVYSSDFKLEG